MKGSLYEKRKSIEDRKGKNRREEQKTGALDNFLRPVRKKAVLYLCKI